MGKPLVLAVYEDADQLKIIKSCLKKEKFKVQTATNSHDAMACMHKHNASILISDENIPDEGGLSFLKHVKHRYPNTVRCLISSDTEAETVVQSIKEKEICSSLQKPWTDTQLIKKIWDCVEHFQTAEANRESMKAILAAYQGQDRHREEDLVLSTAILNVLPQATVVVDENLSVIISNDIFNLKIAVEYGSKSSSLPENLQSQLLEKLKNGWKEFRIKYHFGNTPYIIRIRPLRNTDSKTAILFFDYPAFDS